MLHEASWSFIWTSLLHTISLQTTECPLSIFHYYSYFILSWFISVFCFLFLSLQSVFRVISWSFVFDVMTLGQKGISGYNCPASKYKKKINKNRQHVCWCWIFIAVNVKACSGYSWSRIAALRVHSELLDIYCTHVGFLLITDIIVPESPTWKTQYRKNINSVWVDISGLEVMMPLRCVFVTAVFLTQC